MNLRAIPRPRSDLSVPVLVLVLVLPLLLASAISGAPTIGPASQSEPPAAPGPVLAPAARSPLQCTPSPVDFGELEIGVAKSVDVVLTNSSPNPIDVSAAIPNCGCVESTWPTRPIAAGGNTRATITVTPTESQRGQALRKSVTFVVAGGAPLVVEIVGRVAAADGTFPPAAAPATTPTTANPSVPTPAGKPAPAPSSPPKPPVALKPLAFELRVPSIQPGTTVGFPRLEDWVQGTPEDSYEPGRVYAFEFFGTDCGHCAEFAGLVEELAATFGQVGVRFIAITDEPRSVVEPWLARKREGGGYGYAVTCDTDASAKVELQSGTFRASTPRIFIVKDGVIQWFGHPKDAFEPLGAVVSGQWNPESARAEAILESQVALAKNFIDGVYRECGQTGDWQRALDAVALVRSKLPARAGAYDVQTFGLLIGQTNRPDEGYAFGREVAERSKLDMETTRSLARAILRNGTAVRRDLDLGLELALRADALANGRDARAADTVALAYFSLGDREKAIANGERAVSLSKDPGTRAEFARELEKYRKDPAVPRPTRKASQVATGTRTPPSPAASE